MPKLFSSKFIVKVLLKNGFTFISQKGSHAKYKKSNSHTLIVIVPMARKEIPVGTFRSILFQSQLKLNDFLK